MTDILKELNEAQRAAVEHMYGPSMVIAGPGSGKTRVLTYRIAHLMDQGIAPWQILALTFTNKAAREMKARIESLVGDGARRLWMGTFHSLFARVLRIEAERIGYPADFTIYDTDDSKSVLRELISSMSLDKNRYKVNSIRARISSAKTQLISPAEYARSQDLLLEDKTQNRPYFYKLYAAYEAKLFRAGAMDFDDLLYRMHDLLDKNPDGVREKYQRQFQFIMVDEFQDTNHLQYAILKLLVDYPGSSHNLSIVGDDAQSIYAFRGATIDNILDFQKDFSDVKVYKLEQNYRSTPHIIDAANEIITYNKNQIKKVIWTDYLEGEKIRIIRAISDSEEGRRVADMILEQKNRHHLSNKEIAILYRTNAQSRVFEEHLRKNNITYKVFGGLSFFQRKEIKDLVAYMRLAVNAADDEAWKRVINYPKRGIGSTSVNKVLAYADVQGVPAWEAAQQMSWPARTQNALRAFGQIIWQMQEAAQDKDAYDAAVMIAKTSGIYDLLRSDTSIEGLNRLANVNSLLDGIKEYTTDDEADEELATDKSLSGYLQNIALLTDQDTVDEQSDYVSLMSVHSAKGLEFKSVYVVGLEENLFPSFMALNELGGVDEERRLFYVAITRAERLLTLSYANSRYQHGQLRYNDRSRFIDELPVKAVHESSNSSFSISGASESSGARVSGRFKSKATASRTTKVYENFVASDSALIESGMKVLHQKFGPGEVLSVDGNNNTRVARILFNEINENPERRIMLKFAKLQIIEN